jgi:hypothetical protein
MQQIGDWLKKLGMSEYATRFVENRIDLSVLPDLTDQDLEKLGVLLGDRRKMLRAIRDLGNAQVAATAPSEPVATEPTRQDDCDCDSAKGTPKRASVGAQPGYALC